MQLSHSHHTRTHTHTHSHTHIHTHTHARTHAHSPNRRKIIFQTFDHPVKGVNTLSVLVMRIEHSYDRTVHLSQRLASDHLVRRRRSSIVSIGSFPRHRFSEQRRRHRSRRRHATEYHFVAAVDVTSSSRRGRDYDRTCRTHLLASLRVVDDRRSARRPDDRIGGGDGPRQRGRLQQTQQVLRQRARRHRKGNASQKRQRHRTRLRAKSFRNARVKAKACCPLRVYNSLIRITENNPR